MPNTANEPLINDMETSSTSNNKTRNESDECINKKLFFLAAGCCCAGITGVALMLDPHALYSTSAQPPTSNALSSFGENRNSTDHRNIRRGSPSAQMMSRAEADATRLGQEGGYGYMGRDGCEHRANGNVVTNGGEASGGLCNCLHSCSSCCSGCHDGSPPVGGRRLASDFWGSKITYNVPDETRTVGIHFKLG